MNTSTISLFLQVTASLLAAAHNNPALAPASAQQVVTIGSQSVQLATQAMAPIPFAVPQNTSLYPNIKEVESAAYRTANGTYEPLGMSVNLDQSSLSFGDLNGDGTDDAEAIVTQRASTGATSTAIAIFLNQGGVMFNIADRTLGSAVTVYSHHVVNGALVMDMQVAGESRGTFTYTLLGNRIIKQ